MTELPVTEPPAQQPGEMPGARYAMNIVHPGSPVLRIRYRSGVLVDPYGFPDWVLYARALVELPDPVPGLSVDEMRVLDVLAANACMAGAGEDPLWTLTAPPLATPAGWCWAHLGLSRRIALVPIELHGSYRHGGGVRTMPVEPYRRGLRVDAEPVPVAPGVGDEVPEEVLGDLERVLGHPLPPGYRRYLAATNGAAPAEPAVLGGSGFVADQPLFGVARGDQHQDLGYVRGWLADRFTPDLLPIGYVQGGMLAVGVAEPIVDSVWYWDDDDPRDDAGYGPAEIRTRLLHRCADTFDGFWARLCRPPAVLVELAGELAATGRVRPVRVEDAGEGLPAALRGPGQPAPVRKHDPVTGLFELP
ncbi:MAG TPA: HNH endonuclease [Rugosimonospora sp.]|nr:HNH endonuclease [Rugosimonospora sp.]